MANKTYSNSYCDFCSKQSIDNVNRLYHETEYGFPIESDNELFGRLILEINQAGLSWTTILNKKENFYNAYNGYDISIVANYKEDDRSRLLNDAGIIRNKLKVNAAIHNANVILSLQELHGSFLAWLQNKNPLSKEEWIKLFKKTFKFTGGEITNEFLMSIGFLEGAHGSDCPIYQEILELNPVWDVNKSK